MSFSVDSPPAGWYPDPAGSGGERYWDGGNWSQVTRPAGGLVVGQTPQQAQPAPYVSYAQGATAARQPVLAGFWWRVLASFLDSLIMAIPFGIILSLVASGPVAEVAAWFEVTFEAALRGDPTQPPTPDAAVFYIGIVAAVLWFIYRTVLVTLKGGTLGQLITGLRVLRDGNPVGTNPSLAVSATRALAAVVLGQLPIVAFIDPLVMLFTAKKQTVHDLLARTVVIKK